MSAHAAITSPGIEPEIISSHAGKDMSPSNIEAGGAKRDADVIEALNT